MNDFFFIKWKEDDPNPPVRYEGHPIFQFTQKSDHDELRESQAHKCVIITPAPLSPNSSTIIQTKVGNPPKNLSQNLESKHSTCRKSVRVDFYLDFNVVSSAEEIFDIKHWSNVKDKTLYLWVSTVHLEKCQRLRIDSHTVYKSQMIDIRYHCMEVENQLELTSKHKGIMHHLNDQVFIIGCGEVWVDHREKQVLVNNQSGSLRSPMANNGELMYLHSSLSFLQYLCGDSANSNDPENEFQGLTGSKFSIAGKHSSAERAQSWKNWCLERNDRKRQLDCLFLNYFILPSVSLMCENHKKYRDRRDHSYRFTFDRELKKSKAKEVTLEYIRFVLACRKDVKCKIEELNYSDALSELHSLQKSNVNL